MSVSECVSGAKTHEYFLYIHTTHIVLIDFSFSVIRDLISSIPFHSLFLYFISFFIVVSKNNAATNKK